MRIKNITVLGDSLCMVRPPDLTYRNLYPYLLADSLSEKMLLQVNNRSKRANNSVKQWEPQNIIDDIDFSDSEYFVLHLGVVDSAPRLFSSNQKMILSIMSKIPLFKKIASSIIRVRSKNRFENTKKKPRTEVPLEQFSKMIECILKRIISENKKLEKIFVLPISPPSKLMLTKSFGIDDNTQKYNHAMISVVSDLNSDLIDIIDLNTRPDDDIYFNADGYHLSRMGHKWISDQILMHM